MTISNSHPVTDTLFQTASNDRSTAREVSKPTRSADAEPKLEMPNPEKVKAVLAENNISLNFRRDEASGRIVVEMVDSKTGDAIRQIPSEVSLRLSELFSKVPGQLLEARA